MVVAAVVTAPEAPEGLAGAGALALVVAGFVVGALVVGALVVGGLVVGALVVGTAAVVAGFCGLVVVGSARNTSMYW